jgi:hypothetical protein
MAVQKGWVDTAVQVQNVDPAVTDTLVAISGVPILSEEEIVTNRYHSTRIRREIAEWRKDLMIVEKE